MPNFQDNFDKLKNSSVIPDVDPNMLPQTVRDTIGGLSDDEIQTLVNIGSKTGSHIYLNQEHQIICAF